VQKTREDNWKVEKTGWVVSQMFALEQEHDKIQAWWASNCLVGEHVGEGIMV
jgi:hypothetical protein